MESKTDVADLFDRMPLLGIAAEDSGLSIPIGFLNEVNAATSTKEIYESYASWAQKTVGSDRCSVAMLDDANELIVTAINGASATPIGAGHSLQYSLLGEVFERRSLLFVPDIMQIDLPDTKMLANNGFRAMINAPLVSGPECFGVLNAVYRHDLPDPGEKIALMQAIAGCLATQIRVNTQVECLKLMSQTDPLTKAGNRYLLYDTMQNVWDNWTVSKTQSAYIMLDLDHFKRVNDTFGHGIGDALLQGITDRLKASIRTTDCVVRTGGEEFGIVLRNTQMESAIFTAQRISKSIGRTPFVFDDVSLDVTVSIGISRLEDSDQSFDDMIKRSDDAVYKAKEQGRDQIIVAQDERMIAA